jgi:hypothetical protein
VAHEALLGLGRGVAVDGLGKPPRLAASEAVQRLRPDLISVSLDGVEVDSSGLHRREAARSGRVVQVGARVRRAQESRLSRHFHLVAAVAWPVSIDPRGHERLDAFDVALGQRSELPQLVDPDPSKLL